MPIYEYECQKCGAPLEVVQKVTDSPLKKCKKNKCNGKLIRLISNSSFVLKGSGWYVTDYPSEARKKGMEGEKKVTGTASDKNKKSPGTDKKPSSKPAKKKAVSTT